MSGKSFICKAFILLVFINVILPEKAYAYIDPGTGSMVLQIIIASFIGLGITFKAWMYKIKELLKGRKKHESGR